MPSNFYVQYLANALKTEEYLIICNFPADFRDFSTDQKVLIYNFQANNLDKQRED